MTAKTRKCGEATMIDVVFDDGRTWVAFGVTPIWCRSYRRRVYESDTYSGTTYQNIREAKRHALELAERRVAR